jgi:hypothetical protein
LAPCPLGAPIGGLFGLVVVVADFVRGGGVAGGVRTAIVAEAEVAAALLVGVHHLFVALQPNLLVFGAAP